MSDALSLLIAAAAGPFPKSQNSWRRYRTKRQIEWNLIVMAQGREF
jgi:hypothetical protein